MKTQQHDDLADKIRANSPSRRKRFITLLILLLLLAGAAFALQKYYYGGDDGKPTYVTEAIDRGSIAVTVTATGNLEPTNEVSVGSEISGTMDKVLVDYNDTVEEGQVIAVLDTTKLEQELNSLRASLSVAKASVNQAKATVAESESSLKRLQELHRISGGKTPSQADLDTATATRDRALASLESAKAAVLKAEAEVKVTETDLDKSEIKSPITGIVLSRSVEPGSTVAAQFSAPELFIVAETLTKMKLEVAVAEADIGRMKPGQSASFTVDAWPDRTYEAKVVKVSYASEITDNVVTYEAELEVKNDDLSLRPGMTATADIRVAESNNILMVSNAVLRYKPGSGSTETKEAPKQSLLENLTPGPPRRAMRGGGGGRSSKGRSGKGQSGEGGRANGGGAVGETSMKSIWILDNGEPKQISVATGLTDGRHTEVLGPEVEEGMQVIIREKVDTP
ncbi:efflux RND transporter periplasmic adaptor subunit [Verrucomicrobiaceae bacterium R5-34]|nr:efflux RND transporter periplasmic adaptor subunit [Verrucomicrobiaceae bacterium R5-34]